ncbi:MAG: flagellar assembly protein FliW, partial [Treponema sp.]|nr:flagellar assembly protein FliW [Treponema sp.]
MQVKMKTGATVEVPDAHFITIPEGLFGFETYTRYAIVESGIEPFLWLQSTEDSALAFLIVDPFLACAEYEADIDDESLKNIGVTSPED